MATNGLDEYWVPEHVKDYLRKLGFVLPLDDMEPWIRRQVIAKKKAFTINKPQGKVTYKKTSGNQEIAVASNGKVTVKKGLKKGAYKVKVKVTAKGDANYKSGNKIVTVTIVVK